MSYVVQRTVHLTQEVCVDRVVITADLASAAMLGRFLRTSGAVPAEWGAPLLVLGDQISHVVHEAERTVLP